MKYGFRCFVLLLFVWSNFSVVVNAANDDSLAVTVSRVVQTRLSGQPGCVLSSAWSGKLTVETAYRMQYGVVKQWLGEQLPVGFKAGLTSKAGQEKFSVAHPVAGVLLPGGQRQLENGEFVVYRKDFISPMIEAEIGFRFKEVISKPIADVCQLKTKVASVLPVIELPDLAFDNAAQLKGVDIIANNVAARQFIVGAPRSVDGIDLDALAILLKKDGKLLLEGRGSDAMDSQWQALLWLVNQTLASGWRVEPGQLLITGALGKMLTTKAGEYQVEFGALGKIDFSVR